MATSFRTATAPTLFEASGFTIKLKTHSTGSVTDRGIVTLRLEVRSLLATLVPSDALITRVWS